MDKVIVLMLNALSKGVGVDVSTDLLKGPADYDSTMYQAMVQLHKVAVLPITGVILSIVAVMALTEASTRIDQGDRELGVKMIGRILIKVAIVVTIASSATVILGAINEIVLNISTAANKVNVGPTRTAQPLGDAMSGQIEDLGTTKQLAMLVILLLPWLISVIVSTLASVLVFVRFVQLDILTAFASLPLAFAGMDSTQGIAIGYVKRYATVALQGSVLILAIKLYQAVQASWIAEGDKVDKGTDVWDLIIHNMGDLFAGPFLLAFLLFTSTAISRAIIGEG